MASFKYYNLNPEGKKKNDCVTRAISLASGMDYSDIRRKLYHSAKLLNCPKLCPTCYGFFIQQVLGGVPTNCYNMSINEFSNINNKGTFLIRIQGHLTCLIDNCLFDIWDCREHICDLVWKIK